MFKRLVQLFLLLLLAAVGVLVWFAWYVSTPLLVPVGGDEPSASPVADSLVMEPVEAVSADGTAIEGYLVRPGRPGGLVPAPERRAGYLETARKNAASGGEAGAGGDSHLLGPGGERLPAAGGRTDRSRLHVPGMESAREKRRPEILHVRIEGICGL